MSQRRPQIPTRDSADLVWIVTKDKDLEYPPGDPAEPIEDNIFGQLYERSPGRDARREQHHPCNPRQPRLPRAEQGQPVPAAHGRT